jgi:hypothetical protein
MSPTIEGLRELKLTVMARSLEEQRTSTLYDGQAFEERLGLSVDQELCERKNRRLRLFEDLAIARADGRLVELMASLAHVEVLVVDDLFIRPCDTQQAADLLEVLEDRHQLRATIAGSQRAEECSHLTSGWWQLSAEVTAMFGRGVGA